MKKSWVRAFIAIAGICAIAGQASAQSVSFWYNSLGDATGNQPSVINVTTGSTITLSLYERTTNIGALSGINFLFGYSTTTTAGLAASPANPSFITSPSWAWSNASLTGDQLVSAPAGGSGPASGTTRPFGWFGSAAALSGTITGPADGIDFLVGNLTMTIGAAGGTNIGMNVWMSGTDDGQTSYVLDSSLNEHFPAAPYTGTLHVVAAPEPASIAILGLGVATLIRRRRSK